MPQAISGPSVQMQATLRFACAVTAAFVLPEAYGWYPTFLPAILAATLLASIPSMLSIKAGLMLILVQSAGAFAAFAIASYLRETPIVLFVAIGLVIFLSFAIIARAGSSFPALLVLICFSAIPVVTLAAPNHAGTLPMAFVRSMAFAVTIIWITEAIWPKEPVKTPAATPSPTKIEPVRLALIGTAIVLPLMLVYLMYGITDALPVLITTIVLVVNFDPSRGAMQGFAMILGNFVGGLVAIICHSFLYTAPSLFTLASLTFLFGFLFGRRITKGGPAGAVGLITFNQALIMLSLGLVPSSSGAGIWGTRLFQFAMAYVFAVGLMYLFLPHDRKAPAQSKDRTGAVAT